MPTNALLPKRGQWLLAVAALAPLALATTHHALLLREDPTRLNLIAAAVVFAGLFIAFNFAEDGRLSVVVMGLQALMCALIALGFGLDGEFVFIFFAILSTQLGVSLPARWAALGFTVIVAILFTTALVTLEPLSRSFSVASGMSIGSALFALVGGLLREGLVARARSEALAQELQTANEQLQAMTLKLQQLAIAEERTRMARELHDSLGHYLTAAVMQLEGVQRLLDSNPQRARDLVVTLRAQLKEALAELRQTVSALRMPEVPLPPLSTMLQRLADTVQDAGGLTVHLDLQELPNALSSTHELTLFRAVQEGLTNVQRHAHAQHAWVSLGAENGWVHLRIEDDGIGPPERNAESTGFGLKGLRERAAALGGTLIFGRSPRGGARLELRLPISASGG